MPTFLPPDQVYADLFELIQTQHLLGDSKTFVDATAKSDPADILDAFRRERDRPDFDAGAFVTAHFNLPPAQGEVSVRPQGLPVTERIEQLWDLLTRQADEPVQYSSLIPLPNPYVVPGGRFREVYYWDSYFTMLGLASSGHIDLIEDMVRNFAYLINTIGFIPNGNRSYYCTRSQPPCFALMVELLAGIRGGDDYARQFLPQLRREYEFWMSGAETLDAEHQVVRRVAGVDGAYLNRYWDDVAVPRQESHAEDTGLAASLSRDSATLYRDIRAGAESGWDFSSRWFADGRSMATIRTTQILPVDLNALLYNLESLLARLAGPDDAAFYAQRARTRKRLLQTLFFDDRSGMFVDLELPGLKPTGVLSIAAAWPLFFGVATPRQAARVAEVIDTRFLQAGGWLTTLRETGQQWDRPNGWAPLQWVAYQGLKRYQFDEEARNGAVRWVRNNIAIYRETGRLLEKYNVETSGLAGSGGEYGVQDGFGWTNAVLLRLMQTDASTEI